MDEAETPDEAAGTTAALDTRDSHAKQDVFAPLV